MNMELQDKAWSCLSKEMREWLRERHKSMPYNTPARNIINEVLGYHNLTSDEEPEEMLMVSRREVQDIFNTSNNPNWASNDEEAHVAQLVIGTLDLLFGDKCLPDDPNSSNLSNIGKDEQQSVQVEPKIKVGDKIIVTCGKTKGFTGIVKKYSQDDDTWAVILDGYSYPTNFAEEWIEPYTEPETIENMEDKELNLCELLKGCEREEFYSSAYGTVVLDEINLKEECPIFIREKVKLVGREIFYPDGRIRKDGMIDLYPSRTLYEKYPLDARKAWSKWAEERKPKRWRAKQYEKYWYLDRRFIAKECTADANSDFDRTNYENGNMFSTEDEAQQAAEAVRVCLMKFHDEHYGK